MHKYCYILLGNIIIMLKTLSWSICRKAYSASYTTLPLAMLDMWVLKFLRQQPTNTKKGKFTHIIHQTFPTCANCMICHSLGLSCCPAQDREDTRLQEDSFLHKKNGLVIMKVLCIANINSCRYIYLAWNSSVGIWRQNWITVHVSPCTALASEQTGQRPRYHY